MENGLGPLDLQTETCTRREPFVGGNAERIYIAKYLDKSRLAVTEAVFGVLLAALAVELVLRGLANLGVFDLVGH